ncbi:MAG: radical SAM protein [Thermoanaerobaculia bacterium]
MRLRAIETVAAERYHATVLSNFIRGYDKYARRYTKTEIPESRFPARFFVLSREDLQLGIDRASQLMLRTGLPGERVLVLATRVKPSELRANERTGIGELVERNFIDVDSVYVVDDQQLRAISIEEACAASLACHLKSRPRWDELRPRSVSVLPIARGCQAACNFCFSLASASKDTRQGKLDWQRVDAILDAARDRGAERAVITGGGEPGLLGDENLERLIRACARAFAKVVLITNGYSLARRSESERVHALQRLAEAGLTVLALSRHHHDPAENARIMNLDSESEKVVRSWHAHRAALRSLTLRLVCVLQRGGIDDASTLDAYLSWAASMGVAEVCFKELYVSTSHESVYHSEQGNVWSRENQVPLRLVLDRAIERRWERVGALPWGAPIFSTNVDGAQMLIAAYTEPSVSWELHNGMCRSWNLMSDGRCLASLEDRASVVAI